MKKKVLVAANKIDVFAVDTYGHHIAILFPTFVQVRWRDQPLTMCKSAKSLVKDLSSSHHCLALSTCRGF